MAAHGSWDQSPVTGRGDKARNACRALLHGVGRLIDALAVVRFRGGRAGASANGDAKERWALAVEAAGLGVVEWTAGSGDVTLDARGAALCGIRGASGPVVATREQLRAHIHEEDLARVGAAFEGATEGRRLSVRWRVRVPDGPPRHVQVVARLLPAAGRRPARGVGIVRDVSAEETQVQLALQRDNALALAKARMEFVSRLSHELRTPLNAVVGFAELMTADGEHPLPEPQAQRLQHVVHAGTQLRDLVDEMLDLTKIDAGAIPVAVRFIDASAVLRSAIALVEPLARQYGVQVVNHLGDRPLRVYADPQRLQQVFVNLLTNGCKYNRRGGELVVSSEWGPAGLVVRFADTGTGIAPQDLAELGRPFRRVGAQAAKVEGTGLGLYI
ncbi:MAG TPA: HAMP domain-containing sensor histidine kinase, partial [Albitalea sp.]